MHELLIVIVVGIYTLSILQFNPRHNDNYQKAITMITCKIRMYFQFGIFPTLELSKLLDVHFTVNI